VKRALLGLVLAAIFLATVIPLDRQMTDRPVVVKLGYTPSPGVLRLTAGEFKPLLAEVEVLRVMFYFGSLVENWQKRIQVPPEYANMFRTIETAVHLDPYNMDAYYFAQAAFTWRVGHAADVNRLLEYGMRYRTQDWMLPYFAGFNAAYFLHDYRQAAEYMKQAAELSDQPLLTTLTSRFFYQSGREKMGIAFLKDMIARSRDRQEKQLYELRLKALQALQEIATAVQKYRKDQGRRPADVGKLVSGGYLGRIPQDPYGGTFYLDEKGRVKTTSKLAPGYSQSRKGKSHE